MIARRVMGCQAQEEFKHFIHHGVFMILRLATANENLPAAAGSLSEAQQSLRGVQDRECLYDIVAVVDSKIPVGPTIQSQAKPLLHTHCIAAGRLPAARCRAM